MDENNKKIIIVSLLFILCLISFYGVINYYSNVEIKTIEKEKMSEVIETPFIDNNSSDILLGDTPNEAWIGTEKCKTYKCNCDGLSSSDSDTYYGAQQCMAACYNSGKCATCSDKAEFSNEKCHTCNTALGYKKDSSGKCVLELDPMCGINNFKPTLLATPIRIDTISEGDPVQITVSISSKCPPQVVPSLTIDGKAITLDAKPSHSWTITTNEAKCKKLEITASMNGDTRSKTLTVLGKWNPPQTVAAVTDPPCETEACANAEKSPSPNVYYEKDENGEYTIMHTRGCSSKGYSSEKAACYGDASLLSLATSVKWIKPSQKDSVHRIKIEGVTSSKDCKVPKSVSYCEPKNIAATAQTKNASTCEDSVKLSTKDGLSCDSKPFYTIVCNNDITVKFNNGDDNGIITTTNEIYGGQGFKYSVSVKTNRTCTAKFNADYWKKAYNYNAEKVKLINADLKKKVSSSVKKQLKSALATYNDKLEKLKDMVKNYNNYNVKKTYNEAGTISVDYKVKQKSSGITSKFETIIINEGKGSYSNKSTVKLNISGVTDPYDYDWNSEREIKLIPSKVYLNKDTGKVDTKGIDGGNKVYVDYYIDNGTYTINTSVTSLGGNNMVNNNKCKLKISNQEIIYRPIDVSNPFISKEWKTGSNWNNDLFDFRNVIHSNIWEK